MAGVFIGLAKHLVIWFKTFCGIQINGSFVPKADGRPNEKWQLIEVVLAA